VGTGIAEEAVVHRRRGKVESQESARVPLPVHHEGEHVTPAAPLGLLALREDPLGPCVIVEETVAMVAPGDVVQLEERLREVPDRGDDLGEVAEDLVVAGAEVVEKRLEGVRLLADLPEELLVQLEVRAGTQEIQQLEERPRPRLEQRLELVLSDDLLEGTLRRPLLVRHHAHPRPVGSGRVRP
jgi:hypothetical protein